MADLHDTKDAAALNKELRIIDQVCDRYEQALIAGHRLELTDALVQVPVRARTALLGELLLIESHYGAAIDSAAERFKFEHPELVPNVEAAISFVRHRIATKSLCESPARLSDVILASEPPSPRSRTIDITCPQCGCSSPISIDAKATDIACGACGSTFTLSEQETKSREAAALKTIGKFKLISRLGVGGCGTVWKAYDTNLNRTVAVKIPRFDRLDRPGEDRFLREARTVAQLVHPNIVSVHEIGREGDLSYFVSDFVQGLPLSDWLKEKRVSFRQATALVAKVSDALHYAHEQGVVHRDIKPSNIMMDAEDEPHITDFGLAKWDAADFSIAVEKQPMGTPQYISPEQARGEAHLSDRRTDVYALGVLLFELLTGERPFRGNLDMLVYQAQYEMPASPRKLDKRIPKDLETICLKCLEKPLSRRYESAHRLSEDLRRYMEGRPIVARPVSFLVRGVRWCGRKPYAAAALALLIFISVAGPVAAVYQARLRREADQSKHDLAVHVKELMGFKSEGGESSIDFTLPLVSDRLANSALQQGLALLDAPDGPTSADDKAAKLYLAVGVLAARQGRYEAALEHFHHSEEALQRLREAAPEQLRYVAATAFCQECLGQLYEVLEPRDNAIRHQEAATREWRKLVQHHPDQKRFQRNLAESLLRLSGTKALSGRGETALENVKQLTNLLDAMADNWTDDPDELYLWACELSGCPPVLDDQWQLSLPTTRHVEDVKQEPAQSE